MIRHSLPEWDESWSETNWDRSLNARLRDIRFDLIRSKPAAVSENLAMDAALLFRVAGGRRAPLAHFWDWSEAAVILGSYQSVSDEMDGDMRREAGFVFGRRISGGGAMVVEPGKTITWSLILPESVLEGLSFVQSFAFLDAWCVRALRALGIEAVYRPINDIASPAGKIAGAAQCRRGGAVLHHVAMAYDLEQDFMAGLLRHGLPKRNPKGVPSSEKRVGPLKFLTDLDRDSIAEALISSFGAEFKTRPSLITEEERADAAARMAAQFDSPAWLYRVE